MADKLGKGILGREYSSAKAHQGRKHEIRLGVQGISIPGVFSARKRAVRDEAGHCVKWMLYQAFPSGGNRDVRPMSRK